MKKSFITGLISAILVAGLTFTAAAQESADKAERTYKNEYHESEMSYKNVIVYKVLDQKDAYIVMYAKGHRDVGSVAIPKKWYKETPKKLRFRPLSKGMTSYMTVMYRSGNFDHVILTVPTNRSDAAWGVADSNVQVDADKETLDIVY